MRQTPIKHDKENPACLLRDSAGRVFGPLKALMMTRNGQAPGLNILNCSSAKFHEITKFRVNDHIARQATKPKRLEINVFSAMAWLMLAFAVKAGREHFGT